MTALPHLELASRPSPFDEAVITIDDHEEDTITIELQDGGSLELAELLIRYVNAHAEIVKALTAAAHALRSYEFGNSATDLAHDIAAYCDEVSKQMGTAA